MKQSGVHATKQIFMALINSYAASGKLEKAKQVSVYAAYLALDSKVFMTCTYSKGNWTVLLSEV